MHRARLRPAHLAVVKNARDLHPALCRITDSYYQMFMDVPVVAPSAGNAAGALAAYAAAAGLRATVVMPADAPTANQLEALACGARLVFPTDHDADRSNRPPRDHAEREGSGSHSHLVQADAAEESGRAGNIGKRSRLTARTPRHKPSSGSPSAGAGKR